MMGEVRQHTDVPSQDSEGRLWNLLAATAANPAPLTNNVAAWYSHCQVPFLATTTLHNIDKALSRTTYTASGRSPAAGTFTVSREPPPRSRIPQASPVSLRSFLLRAMWLELRSQASSFKLHGLPGALKLDPSTPQPPAASESTINVSTCASAICCTRSSPLRGSTASTHAPLLLAAVNWDLRVPSFLLAPFARPSSFWS